MGKYKLTNTRTPIYVSALSAPDLNQNLISIGQLTNKHNIDFTKDRCYVLDPSTAPSSASIIGVRGPDNLYRLSPEYTTNETKNKEELAVQALAPIVKERTLYNTFNHSSAEMLVWFQREYPDEIRHIRRNGADDGPASCDACIVGKSRRKPFVNLSHNRYAPLASVSSDTTGPLLQTEIDGNRYLQLLADAGTRHLSGVAMKTKSGASSAIIRALARLQVLCGKTAKRLHTKNADQQDTPDVVKFLDGQDTARTHTAPGSSPSNAIVERRFESIFAATWASLHAAPPPLNAVAYWSLMPYFLLRHTF
eukprot:Plantae.Rhodophyta-Palmaria_palmata.ctg10909.p1 GENE.Plantae.Rhodophyta-Palmaria_palmata.ctg10909~~Plantae.Rhodophyta-Palmaria_palmata.ctg10909.p1  ORF type:complete len:318 (-),score=-12.26 Plantae.Rhodophyta-Palmaria_palmata.ctg10909:264-1187(-)